MAAGEDRPSGLLPPPPTPRALRPDAETVRPSALESGVLESLFDTPLEPPKPFRSQGAFGGFSPTEADTARAAPAPPTRRPPSLRPVSVVPRNQRSSQEPAVLVVGATQAFLDGLEPALARHRVYVETCAVDDVASAVVITAPDLVVLAGDVAREGGTAVLARLASSPHSSVVPVVLLTDDAALEARLRAFRHGAAAVIPKSASMDGIAERIASLAREIPDRGGSTLGDVGEATLSELVEALTKELRTGILSVHTRSGPDEEAVRLVLGAGRPLSDAIEDFVERVRGQVVMAEPLRYEFDERAGGTVQLLGADLNVPRAGEEDIAGLRILLADDDTARADAVTQELRERGVTVVVTDLDPASTRFTRLRQLDPAILLIGEQQARGVGYELMRKLRRDSRLRWSSLLVVRWNEVWTEESSVPAVERILGTLATLAEPEQSARQRADAGVQFDTRLEIMGPARLLRALASTTRALRVTVSNPRLQVQIDLAQGLVVGAVAHTLDESTRVLEGVTALAGLLVLSSGRVNITPVEQPATANVMATVDVALNQADAEPPPIAPSVPAPRRAAAREAAPSMATLEALPAARQKGLPWPLLLGAGGALAVIASVLVGLTVLKPPAGPAAPSPPASAEAPPVVAEAKPPEAKPAPSATATNAELPAAEAPGAGDALVTAPDCGKLLGDLGPPVGTYPGAAYAQLRAARKALMRGDLDETQRCYCRALRFDAENVQTHVEMSRLMVLRRDSTAAVNAARDAVRRAADDRSALLALGDALALSGEYSQAKEPLLRGFGVAPSDEPARLSVARAQAGLADKAARRRDHANEERFFRRAYTLAPDAPTSAGISRALASQGHRAAALVWARKAVTLAGARTTHHVVLGDLLHESGEKAEALSVWKGAAEKDPEDTELRARLLGSR